MAINASFNGATIFKPGAYSKVNIDVGGGFPLGPAGLIYIFGEADAGAPGSAEVNIADNSFTADQLPQIRAKYRSGPIVDAAQFLFAPAADAQIPSGAQTVWIYKTNASLRSSLVLPSAYATMQSDEWGVGSNLLTGKVVLAPETPASETGSTLSFGTPANYNGLSFSIAVNGGAAAIYTLSNTPGNHNSISTLASEINALITGAGLTCVPAGSALKISMAAAPSQYTLGWGRSFEMIDSTPGNLATLGLLVGLYVPASEPTADITLSQKRDNISEELVLGGNVSISIGRDSSGGNSSASVGIASKKLTLTQTAGTIVFDLTAYATLKQLVAAIGLTPGWSATVINSQYAQLSPLVLDSVVSVGAFSASGDQPARLKKDAYEVQQFFVQSQLASLELPLPLVGLPGALTETPFSGGAKGGTMGTDVVTALDKATKFHVNSVVPLFSRDATADIADNLTDGTSSYTIAAIQQSVKTHISLMRTTKKRSERQGYLSLKDTYVHCKSVAGNIGDGPEQLVIQDIRQVNSLGNIIWFQPWALACLIAGSRGGAPVGEPLTFKYLNCSGIRQTAQSMSTPEASIVIDFDPDLQADDAIQAGITFLEAPQTGGFRVVVDNTTYGVDANFVFNRANVLYAADILAYNFRNQLENIYVGKKNTISATDVQSTASSILGNFLAQGITVSTTDAPQGYKSLSVRIVGNTIFISVIVKIVEGIDFILADITIQRATQST